MEMVKTKHHDTDPFLLVHQFIDRKNGPSGNLNDLEKSVKNFMDVKLTSSKRYCYQITISAMHSLCAEILQCEEAAVPREDILEVLAPARAIHGLSPFINRLQTWPKGYPGDYETIEYLFTARNTATDNTIQFFCEEYSLKCPVAQQHRNKIIFQSGKILRTLFKSEKRKRVLCIAPNNFMDLRLIIPYVENTLHEFVLLDADPTAFDFARATLKEIIPQCVFIEGFPTFPPVQKKLQEYAPFDLVTTGGVFDYLRDKHIIKLIRYIFHDLLTPGGELLFTNLDRGNPYNTWMEYLVNWIIIERSQADIERIVRESGISDYETSCHLDTTGLANIIEIRKNR